MNTLVTGAAGFIGSHLCEHLLAAGDTVRAVDTFTDYYARAVKERNLLASTGHPRFTFAEVDLASDALDELLDGVEVVFHLAGQPGVRPSWGREFDHYTRHNIQATQRLLEAVRGLPLRKFVYASSSSIYGDAETLPTSEWTVPRPISPYGVTKLAAEHLCELYRTGFHIPTASLRLFTVYGPRQRPDMAFHRLLRAALTGRGFELYGDGTQTRDFTFVEDVVVAMRRAAISGWCGVANIGGGARISMNDVLAIVERVTGGPVHVQATGTKRGDVRHTGADVKLARDAFGYRPGTTVPQGLAAMWDWMNEAVEVVA